MDQFKLHFILAEQASRDRRREDAGVFSSRAGASRLLSSSNGTRQISGSDPSRREVSISACCGMCLASFAAGMIAGIAVKRRLQRWAIKLLKPRLRRWVLRSLKRRLRRWFNKLLPPPLRRRSGKSFGKSEKY